MKTFLLSLLFIACAASATNAQEQAVQGTGLGLAIVHEIVHAHHGEVSVSSVLGEGTTLRITLPVRRDGGAPN